MTSSTDLHPSDLQGLSRLAIEGVSGTTELVEQLHQAIARVSGPTLPSKHGRTRGITGLVYRCVHGVTGLVGSTLDLAFDQIVPRLPLAQSTPRRDRALAALNGVLGDHLEISRNPLAMDMRLRLAGKDCVGLPQGERKIAVFIHGLCMSDHHWAAPASGDDQADLPRRVHELADYLHVQLLYNSGRSISHNGRDFAELIESLVGLHQDQLDDLVLIGHSMGGLVARSAVHHAVRAGHGWTDRVSRLITLGTPHHGAPLERIGHQVERVLGMTPFSRPFTRLGQIRSAGITDLRHGRLIEPRRDGEQASSPSDCWPPHTRLYAVAASLADRATSLRSNAIGDGLVTVSSALAHRLPENQRPPPERHKLVTQCGHLRLLHHPEVADQVINWLVAN